MQYLNETEHDIRFSQYLAERAKKALGERPQSTLFQKQATFDNYGLARPKMPVKDGAAYEAWKRGRA